MTQILFVDDEQNVLQALQRNLRGKYECDVALGGEEGLTRFDAKHPIGVVVSDMRMPGMNGIEFLKKVKERSPDTVRVMLTGNSDLATAIEAVNEGSIFRFVSKPCPPEKLCATLDASIRQYELITAEKTLLEKTLGGCVKVLTEILAMANARLFVRCTSLQESSRKVTRALGLEKPWEIESAAMLAQIGSVAIPPVVMVRARAGNTLTGPEKDMLARIPSIGHDLLSNVPRMEQVAEIVKYQSKNYDGSGYPVDAVKGTDIPLGGRLLRILNDLTTAQESGATVDVAFAQLSTRAGSYDPQLLQQVRGVLGTPAAAVVQPTEVCELPLRELERGAVLAADIVTNENMTLVAAGQTISVTILERLHNFAATVGIREPILIRRTRVASRV